LKSQNAALCEKEFREGIVDVTCRPQVAWLEITDRCQLDCVMCLRKMDVNVTSSDMPREVSTRLLTSCPRRSDLWRFSGSGEPMLAKDFEYYLGRLQETGARIEITTNAQAFTEDKLQAVLP